MLSKKADLIIGALSKLINYLKDSQKRSIFNSIIEISFSTVLLYRCFVVEHEKIQSKLQIYHTTDFDTMLQTKNDTDMIYEMKNKLNPPIMDFMFEKRNNMCNFRNFQEFATKKDNLKLSTTALRNYSQFCLKT